MADQDSTRPRWGIAPYFLVDDVVSTANDYRDVQDLNGYRLCFGHDLASR